MQLGGVNYNIKYLRVQNRLSHTGEGAQDSADPPIQTLSTQPH
jgi:hypothetical protein